LGMGFCFFAARMAASAIPAKQHGHIAANCIARG